MDVHPWHQHPLEMLDRRHNHVDSGKICQVCMCPLNFIIVGKIRDGYYMDEYYRCKERCDYYIHYECFYLIQDLKDKRQVLHPLHPQHHLTLHFDDGDDAIIRKFVCSFCRQTTESKFFFHCSSSSSSSSSSLSCDFYLDISCSTAFVQHPDLVSNFHIQHFFHHPDDIRHRLSPCILHYERGEKGLLNWCELCGPKNPRFNSEDIFTFKCITCDYFYLHVQCSQVPQEISEHYHHPQHTLILLPSSRAMDLGTLYCHACRFFIFKAFFLSCTDQCCDFNLHIQCVFLKPDFIPNSHHHPLVHFEYIYLDGIRCSACNTCCKQDMFRCIACNYNIHCRCISLPITVDNDDLHVHPLTLTPSFKENNPTDYYCDICETKRDPNHGIYLCEECRFLAHFRCALPKDHPLMVCMWY